MMSEELSSIQLVPEPADVVARYSTKFTGGVVDRVK